MRSCSAFISKPQQQHSPGDHPQIRTREWNSQPIKLWLNDAAAADDGTGPFCFQSVIETIRPKQFSEGKNYEEVATKALCDSVCKTKLFSFVYKWTTWTLLLTSLPAEHHKCKANSWCFCRVWQTFAQIQVWPNNMSGKCKSKSKRQIYFDLVSHVSHIKKTNRNRNLLNRNSFYFNQIKCYSLAQTYLV